jgi:hypothetical protein
MKMNKNALITAVLGLILLFPGSFTAFRYLATDYSNSQARGYGYGYNYNYGYNNYGGYSTHPAYLSGAGNYVAGYGNGNYGLSPHLMASTSCNSLYGCRQNYVSHIYVRNALDYTYYTHPELLATRYMDNHQRYYKGLWPQTFSY